MFACVRARSLKRLFTGFSSERANAREPIERRTLPFLPRGVRDRDTSVCLPGILTKAGVQATSTLTLRLSVESTERANKCLSSRSMPRRPLPLGVQITGCCLPPMLFLKNVACTVAASPGVEMFVEPALLP
jgi:hypothetical protein